MPASDDATPALPGLSPICGRPIEARFDGGLMSSDGGLLVLRQIEQRLGIARRLASCMSDPRAPERIAHGLDEIIRFRMLMIAAGYEEPAGSRRATPTNLFQHRAGHGHTTPPLRPPGQPTTVMATSAFSSPIAQRCEDGSRNCGGGGLSLVAP